MSAMALRTTNVTLPTIMPITKMPKLSYSFNFLQRMTTTPSCVLQALQGMRVLAQTTL